MFRRDVTACESDRVEVFGRTLKKISSQTSGTEKSSPLCFQRLNYEQGFKDANTDLLIRDVIECDPSRLSEVIGGVDFNQMKADILRKRDRCDEALKKVEDFYVNLKKQSGLSGFEESSGEKLLAGSGKHVYKKRKHCSVADNSVGCSKYAIEQPCSEKETSSSVSGREYLHHKIAEPGKARKKRSSEIALNLPDRMDQVVGVILRQLNDLRDRKGGAPDLNTCWFTMISGEYGAINRRFLSAISVNNADLQWIHDFQSLLRDSRLIKVETGHSDNDISDQGYLDLREYLSKHVFNGKLVGFVFDRLVEKITREDSKDELDAPPKLRWLSFEIRRCLNYEFISTGKVLELDDISAVLKDFHGGLAVQFLRAMTLDERDRLKSLRNTQHALDSFFDDNEIFGCFSKKDSCVKPDHSKSLFKYLKKNCFNKKVVCVDLSTFLKSLEP
ncbi:hypothetical protein [Endozoicomonas elysicola]|uniref:Uncharacterized protein n=2 Tax=Endozoicomonas elysicola TaxID=305900 RepID=A0A081K9X8_9GAMM|nr:hypothetical protein [Endozoicomonas elysicola]KEI70954.1 hypothetical protein GV64_09570 [Endozoicomonas elysicola]